MAYRRNALVVAASLLTALTAACSNDATAPNAAPTSSSLASRGADNTAGATSGATSSSASRIRLEIALKGSAAFPAAKGKAKWQQDGNNRELQIEIENVRAGTSLNFFVGGARVGATQVADAFGKARINLSTQLGQSVPTTVSGASVSVQTTAGAVVASGSF